MTRPIKSSKLLLVADRGVVAAKPAVVPIRRYRLARLRLDSAASGRPSRFEHLKRVSD